MTKRVDMAWHLKKGYEPTSIFIDPRLPVVKHIGWSMNVYHGKTFNRTPEPDNYNFAIFAKRAYDIEGIRFQTWYRDRMRGGWFSLSVLRTPEETQLAHNWLQANDWYGYWLYEAAPAIRPTMTSIEQQTLKKNTKPEPCLDELLFNQGFYDKLLIAGLDEISLQRMVGTPREINYEPDL
jgi:hypothetical protein